MQPRRAFAHGQAAQDQHLQQQAARTGGQIDGRVPLQPSVVIEDRLLRQPVQPAARPDRHRDRGPRRRARRAIGAFGGLGRGQGARTRPQVHAKGQPVARCQPARGVQEDDLGQARGHAGQHRLGRPALGQVDQATRPHDHMRRPVAALHADGWGTGVEHGGKGRRTWGKVNRCPRPSCTRQGQIARMCPRFGQRARFRGGCQAGCWASACSRRRRAGGMARISTPVNTCMVISAGSTTAWSLTQPPIAR
ncbi:hypothetical protein CP157_02573 [Paracoccus marcusii]|nr:hypothetical protein CP157_02573 [Paracoccus marcusii]